MSPKAEKLVHCTCVCVPTVEKHYTILVLGLPAKKLTKILNFEGFENCIFDSVETGMVVGVVGLLIWLPAIKSSPDNLIITIKIDEPRRSFAHTGIVFENHQKRSRLLK